VHPQLNLVGHIASLQSGFFGLNPYKIPSGQVNRMVYRQNVGVALKFFGLYAEYFQTWTSPEFSGGTSHGTGGLQIGF
jgi:hypothetical protein